MREKIESFLKKKTDEINELAEFYPEKKALYIDYTDLERFDHEVAEELIQKPDEVISLFDEVLSGMNIPTMEENPRIHVRFKNLPKERGYTLMIRDVTSSYIGRFMAVEGVVNRISDILPKVSVARFYCNRCGEGHDEIQSTRFLTEPVFCRNCRRKDFRFVPDESEWTDVQRLQIQEPLELLEGGEEARQIEVWAEDDLTGEVTAGDKIIETGVMRLLPPQKRGSVYRKFLEANFLESVEKEFAELEISKEEEKEIKKLSKDPRSYEKIINSIAPSIYGYKEIKEAVALQMFGGRYGKKLPDGTSVRSDMHILLIGEPGVAKSRLLQYINQIAPKSIYVAGKGTTGAGLTVTAERDEFAEGAWTLKAGALILAGGGIACIDEFDKMSTEDRSAMHEALEQQTVSVAKAGIVATFKADTAVLAAANPKFSRFDPYKPLSEQFDIPATLLSRFDLIFPIRDILDKEQDKEIAEHILKIHRTGEGIKDLEPEIPTELLRKYVAYARRNIHPVLSDDAAEKIKEFYIELRAGSKETVMATPRQLEALVRLSEASAKMRLSNTVTVSDAERAIALTEFVLREIAYDESLGRIDIDRIVSEHPKSTRDRIRVVEDIINGLIAASAEGMASFDDIIEEAKSRGLDRFTAEGILSELKNKGVVFEPRHGRYMLTEG
ncbi:MAG: minichromosome maintenance protein MCM [Candidatus Altiarchaeota archaeon]|nr:minichromosome maintenance protein MCM [Candidatus Altiarchaeota archaeon]